MDLRYISLCTPAPGDGCDTHGPDCTAPGKRPVSSDWTDGGSTGRPTGNAGILTGPATGLLVIDVDTAEGAEAYASWGLPATYTVRSGREEPAHHYYFHWPAGLLRVPDRLDGVEIKGPGRQVVAAWSQHKSGRLYAPINDVADMAQLPVAFVERLRASAKQIERGAEVVDATDGAVEALERILAELPEATELGDGNVVTLCPAHPDHDPSLVLTVSGDRVLMVCRAGCTSGEVLDALGMDGSALFARPELDVFDPYEELMWVRVVPSPLGTQFKLTTLLDAELPEIRWAVPGMVPEGLTLLAGPPKLGKSWFVLDLAIRVAAGRDFLGIDVAEGDVLYLALEDNARRLKGRAQILLAGEAAPDRLELWTQAGKLNSSLIPQLADWLDRQEDPRLVVIDTLGRVQGHGELDAKDGGYADAVEALVGLQDLAAARGVAVVVITHTKKGGWSQGADPLEAVLGSQGYAGTADSILVLKRERGEDLGELFITGREIEDQQVLKVRFDDAACRWIRGGERSLEQEIVKVLNEQPFKLTGTGVVNAVGHRKADVLDKLRQMEDDGKVIRALPASGGWHRWGPAGSVISA